MRYLQESEVLEIVPFSKSTLRRMEGRGEFPARRKISPNRVAWLDKDVEEWMSERPLARESEVAA